MRVAFLMNPDAGSGNHDRDAAIARFERHAHVVRTIDAHARDLRRKLRSPTDLVVVGGGDGTVAKVARALAGTATPVHIIPIGTANNIARSLGIRRREWNLEKVVSTWTCERIDTLQCGGDIVIESAGCGAIAQLMRVESGGGRTLRAQRTKLRRLIQDLPPFDYVIDVDGRQRAGEAVLIEVMVMPQIGPRVALAPRASPSDGVLDVVIVDANDRERLTRHLGLRNGSRAELRTMRGRNATVRCDAPWHLDDELRPRRVQTAEVSRDAWRVYVPKENA